MAFIQCPPRTAVGVITMSRSKGGMSAAPTSKVACKGQLIRPSLAKAAWSQNVGHTKLVKVGPREQCDAHVKAYYTATFSDRLLASKLAALAHKLNGR